MKHLDILNRATGTEWDQIVDSHPGATVFHSSAWARVVCETYGHNPCYIGLFRQNEPVALVPLIEVVSPFTGRRGVCLPFTDACGPLVFQEEAWPALQQELEQLAIGRRWRHVEVRGGEGFDSGADSNFFEHTLPLTTNPDHLLEQFSGATRGAIRQAIQNPLQIDIGTTINSMHEFYRLHARTRKKHGVPPQPFRFFAKIQQHLLQGQRGFVILARQGSRAVAGAVFLLQRSKAIYKFAASDPKLGRLRGNNLVLWEAIRHLISHGCDMLDFGRTSLQNEGLRRFKLSWGAKEHMIGYHRFDVARGAWIKPDVQEGALHKHVFRSLPLALNRFAGAMAYPHLD